MLGELLELLEELQGLGAGFVDARSVSRVGGDDDAGAGTDVSAVTSVDAEAQGAGEGE